MFLGTALLLSRIDTPLTICDWIIQNSLDECFGIHFRVLFAFLYLPPRHIDDVTAHAFMENGAEWDKIRPKPSALLSTARNRANKQIAHLTKKRVFGNPPEKAWPVDDIVAEIVPVLDVFVQHSSPERLNRTVVDLLKNWRQPEYHASLPDRPLRRGIPSWG